MRVQDFADVLQHLVAEVVGLEARRLSLNLFDRLEGGLKLIEL